MTSKSQYFLTSREFLTNWYCRVFFNNSDLFWLIRVFNETFLLRLGHSEIKFYLVSCSCSYISNDVACLLNFIEITKQKLRHMRTLSVCLPSHSPFHAHILPFCTWIDRGQYQVVDRSICPTILRRGYWKYSHVVVQRYREQSDKSAANFSTSCQHAV